MPEADRPPRLTRVQRVGGCLSAAWWPVASGGRTDGENDHAAPLGLARVCLAISLPTHCSRPPYPSQPDLVPRPCLCVTKYTVLRCGGHPISPHHTTTPPPHRCDGIRIFALPWCVCPPAALSSSSGPPHPTSPHPPAPKSGTAPLSCLLARFECSLWERKA